MNASFAEMIEYGQKAEKAFDRALDLMSRFVDHPHPGRADDRHVTVFQAHLPEQLRVVAGRHGIAKDLAALVALHRGAQPLPR